MLLKRLFAVLCIGCTAITNLAVADQESFEQAVNLYMKGFKECVDAHGSRGNNIEIAKRKYRTYLTYKEQAIAIDPSILTSAARSMQKNLKYCEKAYDNILRAEAEPILTAGVSACEKAKKQLESGELPLAKASIDLYETRHTEALSITESILDVYSIASKVRSCNRLKKKIAETEEVFRVQEEESQRALVQLIEANDHCAVARQLAISPQIKFDDIEIIKLSLDKTKNKIDAAQGYTAAFIAAQNYPNRDSSNQIKLHLNKISACTKEVNTGLTIIQAKKENAENTINRATINVKKAFNNCTGGRSLVEGRLFQYENLDKAWWYYQESKNYKNSAEKHPGAQLAEQHQTWYSSKQYKHFMTKAKKCQILLAKRHRLRTAEYNKKKKQIKMQKAERQARLLEDKRKADEEKLRALEKDRKTRETAINELKAKRAAKKAALEKDKRRRVDSQTGLRNSWTDLVDDQNTAEEDIFDDDDDDIDDEDLEDEDASSQDKGKSWTDLIP